MRHTLARNFELLDRATGPVTIQRILEWFESHPLSAEDLGDCLVFNTEHYVRNLLHAGPGYQALVLCWRNGQRSPIHNHRGSHCGVRVLRGTATETLFETGPNGMVVPSVSRQLPKGHVSASIDADTHQVSNLQAGNADLITLHVYSPPLVKMDVFSLDSPLIRDWEDPIHDPLMDGGGI